MKTRLEVTGRRASWELASGNALCSLAPHGISLLDGWTVRQVLVFGAFNCHKRNLGLDIEVQAPAVELGQGRGTHACMPWTWRRTLAKAWYVVP